MPDEHLSGFVGRVRDSLHRAVAQTEENLVGGKCGDYATYTRQVGHCTGLKLAERLLLEAFNQANAPDPQTEASGKRATPRKRRLL